MSDGTQMSLLGSLRQFLKAHGLYEDDIVHVKFDGALKFSESLRDCLDSIHGLSERRLFRHDKGIALPNRIKIFVKGRHGTIRFHKHHDLSGGTWNICHRKEQGEKTDVLECLYCYMDKLDLSKSDIKRVQIFNKEIPLFKFISLAKSIKGTLGEDESFVLKSDPEKIKPFMVFTHRARFSFGLNGYLRAWQWT